MAYRTIGVKVAGQSEVEAMSKSITKLQREVANVIRDIKGMGRQNSVASFNIKLKLDTDSAITQFAKLKRELERHTIDLKIEGLVKSSSEFKKQYAKSFSAVEKEAKSLGDTIDKTLKSPSNSNNVAKEFDNMQKKAVEASSSIKELDNVIKRIADRGISGQTSKFLSEFSKYVKIINDPSLRNKQISSAVFGETTFVPRTPNGNISRSNESKNFVAGLINDFDELTSEEKVFFTELLRINKAFENGDLKIRELNESMRALGEQAQNVLDTMSSLVVKSTQLAVANPAQKLLHGFVSLNKQIVLMNTNIGKGVGNVLMSSLNNVFSQIRMFASQVISTLKTETAELGDAMEVYRLSMMSLGFNETETNLSMKRLGDYGKASVYDAKDLLGLASSLYAYDRQDAEDIVKAIAGLTAQTNNPMEKFRSVQTQFIQMMSAGVLNQQDWRIMREAMNAMGQADVVKSLEALAQSKGYSNIVDATRKRAISSDEVIEIIKDVGGSDKFQNLVTSILTPSQAIANLKERLANLFVFDEIDDQGNAIDGPLKNMYDGATSLLEGVGDVIGSAKFKEYVKAFGKTTGNFLESVSNFGKRLDFALGNSFLASFEKFFKDLTSVKMSPLFEGRVYSFVKAINSLLSVSGSHLGRFTSAIATEVVTFLTELTKVGEALVTGGFLAGVTEVVNLYKNIASTAVSSGAVSLFAKQFYDFYLTVNKIIQNENTQRGLKGLVTSLDKYITLLYDGIEYIGTKTSLIPTVLNVLKYVVDFYSEIIKNVSNRVSPGAFENFLKNLKNAIKRLLDALAPIYTELLSSVINTVGSSSMDRFINAIVDFIVAMNRAFIDMFRVLGKGDVQKGMENLLNFFSLVVEVATSIVNSLGGWTFSIPLLTRFGTFAVGLIQTLGNVWQGLQALNLVGATSGVSALGTGVGASGIAGAGGTIGGLFSKSWGGSAGLIPLGWSKTKDAVSSLKTNGISGLFSGSKAKLMAGGSSLWKGITSLKGQLMIGLADWGASAIDDAVYNSSASASVKKATTKLTGVVNVLASTAQWASMGSLLGGPYGAIAGGIIGFGAGVYGQITEGEQREKAEREAKALAEKEVRELTKERKTALVGLAKEVGESSRSMVKSYFSSIKGDEKQTGSLSGAFALISQIASQYGTTYSDALKRMNINMQIPDMSKYDLNEAFVELDGKLVSLQSIMDETGLSVEEVMGTLQYAFSTTGEKVVTITDKTKKVLEATQALTTTEEQRIDAELQKLNEELAKQGVSSQVSSVAEASQMEDALTTALQGNYNTDKEQEEAIALALTKGDKASADALVNQYSLEDLKRRADGMLTALGDTAYTIEEAKAKLLEKISQSPYISPSELEELQSHTVESLEKELARLEEMSSAKAKAKSSKDVYLSWKELQPIADIINNKIIDGLSPSKWLEKYKGDLEYIQGIVDSMEDSSQDSIDYVSSYIQPIFGSLNITNKALQDKIIAIMIDKDVTLQEAIDILSEEYGGKDNINSNLSKSKQDFEKSVYDAVDKGAITLSEAKDILNSAGISYDHEAQKERIRQAISNLASKVSSILGQSAKTIEDAIANPTLATSNKTIPVYRGAVPTASTGGMISSLGNVVYRSGGGSIWKSRGTDIVPAMLTEGEYVLRKKAVASVGLDFLQKLNQGGAKALQSTSGTTIINNVYNNNNAKINQNIDNKSQYLNGMLGMDRLMRYV